MMRERCPYAKFLTLAGPEMDEVFDDFEALKNEAMTDQGSLLQANTRDAKSADCKSD
jgi:hypothetical protein